MSRALERWNRLADVEAENELLACCGSRAWAQRMAGRRPFGGESELLAAADETWWKLSEVDWMEAFRSHPRIGESCAEPPPVDGANRSAHWSAQEQSGVAAVGDAIKVALVEANREYEQRFGHIFIVCATGRSAVEILEALEQRLQNDARTELREAAEQQRQITQIRLRKWLAE